MGLLEYMPRMTSRCIEDKPLRVVHLEETVRLVRKRSMVDVDLPWRYV